MKKKNSILKIIMLTAGMLCHFSCVKDYLPEKGDYFDPDGNFSNQVFRPVLGRTQLISGADYNPGNSNQPITFEITRLNRYDGTPAPELMDTFPVRVWKKAYTGNENSVEEINAKRGIENRRLFEVRKHSGEFVMYENAASAFVKCEPDSCYTFDVVARNSGGYKNFYNLKLLPQREQEVEPAIYDPMTGLPVIMENPITKEKASGFINPVRTMNIVTTDNLYMWERDIHIYFRKLEMVKDEPDIHTLTFRFYGPNYEVIPPSKFNLTKWGDNELIHGFIDKEKTDMEKQVTYKVAYPIPVFAMPTRFTNIQGDKARIVFSYDRKNRYGYRQASYFNFDFALYAEANWEIYIVFTTGMPKFEDEQ